MRLKKLTINGFKNLNGFEIDFEWENSKITQLNILSTAGKKCKIMLPSGLLEFDTEKGKWYDVLKLSNQ